MVTDVTKKEPDNGSLGPKVSVHLTRMRRFTDADIETSLILSGDSDQLSSALFEACVQSETFCEAMTQAWAMLHDGDYRAVYRAGKSDNVALRADAGQRLEKEWVGI